MTSDPRELYRVDHEIAVTVHEVAEPVDQHQDCLRCGLTVADARGAHGVEGDTEAYPFWPAGELYQHGDMGQYFVHGAYWRAHPAIFESCMKR